jgi:predicted nucleic acid-binding protein
MATYLLDTNVIIHLLRGQKNRAELLEDLVGQGHTLASCPVTLAEVYAGMRPREERATRALMSSLEFLPMTSAVAEHAGLLKRDYAQKGLTLTLADAMIAATAIGSRCILMTENAKDFPMKNLVLYPLTGA